VFNLQGGELIIIAIVALVVLGPEKLPEAARRIGQIYSQIRRMGDGFVDEFRQAVDEPIVELRRQVDDVASSISASTDLSADDEADGHGVGEPSQDEGTA
jgi:Tat protein translocase TatB subunit